MPNLRLEAFWPRRSRLASLLTLDASRARKLASGPCADGIERNPVQAGDKLEARANPARHAVASCASDPGEAP
jgi:hypothetical protein